MLEEARYRSTTAYLEQFRREHIERGYPYSEALRLEFRRAVRAAERGLGPRRHAGSFSPLSLAGLVLAKTDVKDGVPAELGAFVCTCIWWMMREIEASLRRMNQVTVAKGSVAVLDY